MYTSMFFTYAAVLIILFIGAFLSVRAGKLTASAGVTGFVTGVFVFAGVGYTAILMLATFFALGTAATSWGIRHKQKLGLAEKNRGRRTAGQVLANGGGAAVLGLLSVINPSYVFLFRLMMAASLASATADTLSSELGNVYGRKFYNIVTGKKDTRGLDGVISLEGTLIGIAGSIFIAAIYSTGFGLDRYFVLIVIAGTVGNLTDSFLGATLERNKYLNNDAVNFLNTTVASLTILLYYLFQ